MRGMRGFTLLELLVVVVIFGIIMSGVLSIMPLIEYQQRQAYNEGAYEKNRAVANGILQFANEGSGRLPAPVTVTAGGQRYTSVAVSPTAVDTASVSLRAAIQSQSIATNHMFNDGTFAQNVRVYQRVAGLTRNVPFRGISGDIVTITFDVGIVYQTACPALDSCNTAGVLPGASPALTSVNYNTWQAVSPDSQPYFISTFEHQKKLLDLTNDTISVLIRRIQNDFAYRSITSAANDITNWYMRPNNAGAPGPGAITNSTTNEGCYETWYTLGASNVNVLERYGLNKSSYGKTAWGGDIQFCRDYDPSNSGKNTVPHSAAIRFNRNVTTAAAPVVGQNIVIAM